MNNKRRKRIREIIKRLQALKGKISNSNDYETIEDELEDIYADVDDILAEETDYMDNIPENLQYSSRYEVAEEACDNLQESVEYIEAAQEMEDDIEKVNDYIDKSIEYLYDASK